MHLSTNNGREEIEDLLNFISGAHSDLERKLEVREDLRSYPQLERELQEAS